MLFLTCNDISNGVPCFRIKRIGTSSMHMYSRLRQRYVYYVCISFEIKQYCY